MNILLNTLSRNKKKIIFFSLASIFYTFFLLYVWTLMEDTFSQVLDLFPEPIKKIAGFGDDLSTAGFLNGEFMHLIGPLIMGAFGITIGSTILASEEENKTIDQFLSLSISRTRYYTEKYISLIILVFLLSLVFSITLLLSNILFDINLTMHNILYSGFCLFIYGITTGSISYFSGAFFAKVSISVGIGGGVALIGYVFDSVYKTVSSLSYLKYFSLHYYYNDNGVIMNGFDILHLFIMLLITTFCYFFGLLIFNKRDIKS
ncbi:MAG: hypothetical protein CL761_01910 [Chloroflexi bacterium]|nr:hypothetical protein [Chloroflexota bacterium]